MYTQYCWLISKALACALLVSLSIAGCVSARKSLSATPHDFVKTEENTLKEKRRKEFFYRNNSPLFLHSDTIAELVVEEKVTKLFGPSSSKKSDALELGISIDGHTSEWKVQRIGGVLSWNCAYPKLKLTPVSQSFAAKMSAAAEAVYLILPCFGSNTETSHQRAAFRTIEHLGLPALGSRLANIHIIGKASTGKTAPFDRIGATADARHLVGYLLEDGDAAAKRNQASESRLESAWDQGSIPVPWFGFHLAMLTNCFLGDQDVKIPSPPVAEFQHTALNRETGGYHASNIYLAERGEGNADGFFLFFDLHPSNQVLTLGAMSSQDFTQSSIKRCVTAWESSAESDDEKRFSLRSAALWLLTNENLDLGALTLAAKTSETVSAIPALSFGLLAGLCSLSSTQGDSRAASICSRIESAKSEICKLPKNEKVCR